MWTNLRADAFRLFGTNRKLDILRGIVTRRPFRVIVSLRLCQAASASAWARPLRPLARAVHKLVSHHCAVDLPSRTNIGAGLTIVHGWGIVINEGAKIGCNVTLFHGVTLGRRDRIDSAGGRSTGYPLIEDEVWIGPHAIIVGAVTVGRGSRIGGGAFVTEDVPSGAVVVGNPASVVKLGASPDVMNRAAL